MSRSRSRVMGATEFQARLFTFNHPSDHSARKMIPITIPGRAIPTSRSFTLCPFQVNPRLGMLRWSTQRRAMKVARVMAMSVTTWPMRLAI
jgi:hypothetical protein